MSRHASRVILIAVCHLWIVIVVESGNHLRPDSFSTAWYGTIINLVKSQQSTMTMDYMVAQVRKTLNRRDWI